MVTTLPRPTNGRMIPKAPEGDGGFEHFGHFLKAAHMDRKTSRPDTRLAKDMSTGLIGGGGALVPENFRNELLVMGQDVALVRGRGAMELPAPNGILRIPIFDSKTHATDDFGGLQVQWVREGDPFTGDPPELKQIRVETLKNGLLIIASAELVEDAPEAFGTYVTTMVGAAYARSENRVFLKGSGAGQPQGLLNSNAVIEIAKETAQVADTVIYENVLNMEARLLDTSWQQANWYCHKSVLKQLRQMTVTTGTGGGPVYQEGVGGRFLLGRPVVTTDLLPVLGEKADICLLDVTQYVIVDFPTMIVETSEAFGFNTDEVFYRIKARTNGLPLTRKAVTPENGTDTESPYIILGERG